MNKQLRQNFAVGLVLLMGVALIVFATLYIQGNVARKASYNFDVQLDNALGILPSADVLMAGIKIGSVETVTLTSGNKALLKLRVDNNRLIPNDSRFVIITGLLTNNPVLEVRPGKDKATVRANSVVEGSSEGDLTSVLNSGKALADNLNGFVGDAQTQADLKATIRNIRVLTEGAARFSSDRQTQADLKATITNLKATTDQLPALTAQAGRQLKDISARSNALLNSLEPTVKSGQRIAADAEGIAANTKGITGELQTALKENRATLKSLLQNADEATSAIAGLTLQAKEALGDKKLRENLSQSAENLASISARLDAVTADIQRLSSDPRLASDLRDTVSNLKETSTSFRNLAARVETVRIPGERRRPQPGESPAPPRPSVAPQTVSLLEPGLNLDAIYDTKAERLRLDTNYTLLGGASGLLALGGPGTFYRIGVQDLTERNRLNLQFGQYNGSEALFALRYGIFAGKLGLGADARTGPLDLRLDVYDPNRLQINARAKGYLNRDQTTALTVGVDSIGKENRAVLGVQIRR